MASQCYKNEGQDTQNGLQTLHVWPGFLSSVILSPSSRSLHFNYSNFFHVFKSIMPPSITDFVYVHPSLQWDCLTLTLHCHITDLISSFSFQLKVTSLMKPYTLPTFPSPIQDTSIYLSNIMDTYVYHCIPNT